MRPSACVRRLALACLLWPGLLPARAQDAQWVTDDDPWDTTPDTTKCDATGYKQCSSGEVLNSDPANGEKCCGEGYQQGGFLGLECKECPAHTYKNSHNLFASCVACAAGKHQRRKQCRSCESCAEATNCAQSAGAFALAACSNHDKCARWWNRKTCSDDRRLVVSVVPDTWHSIPETSTCSETPLPVCRSEFGDSRVCFQASSQQCLRNAHSFSWPPCSLVGVCFSVAGLHSEATTLSSADKTFNVWDKDFSTAARFDVLMRIPSSMEVSVQVHNDKNCNTAIPFHAKTSNKGTPSLFRWGGASNMYFKISHLADSSTNFCACPHDTPRGATVDSEGYFVEDCKACSPTQFLRPVAGGCLGQVMGCTDCDANHVPDAARRGCARCPEATPARPAAEAACRACADHEYFMIAPQREWKDQTCTALKSMTVLVSGQISQAVDEYRTSPFETATPHAGEYRSSMQSVASCQVASVEVCNLNTGQYLHGCVGSIPANRQFYVRVLPAAALVAYTQFDPSQAGITEVVVERIGKCMDCDKCDSGQYLLGCMRTDADHTIANGVQTGTHDQNKGTCQSCGKWDLQPDEYYWHPQRGNCSGWPTEFSTRPYDVLKCAPVLLSTKLVFLTAGCNQQELAWWSVNERDTSADGRRSVPARRTCAFGGTGACDVPLYAGHTLTGSTALWWSAYHQPATVVRNMQAGFEAGGGTARIPYCPPGWHVDSECAAGDAAGSPQWNPECCHECKECSLENGEKRSQDWVACSGATIADTQSFCQPACDMGYYEDRVTAPAGDYSVCKQCELC